MPKILIADDHPLFRDAIKDVVRATFAKLASPYQLLEATAREEVLRLARAEDPDLILLDLFMPGATGLSLLIELRNQCAATPIVIVSSLQDAAAVERVARCGAAGFIHKSSSKEQIAAALLLVLEGGVAFPATAGAKPDPGASESGEPLTPRQIAVLARLAEGRSNKEIARELAISEMTVKVHVTAILRKLGVATRAQAIVAFRHLEAHGTSA